MSWRKSSKKILGVTFLNGGKLHAALFEIHSGKDPILLAKQVFEFENIPFVERKRLFHGFLARAGRRAQFRHLIFRDRAFTKQFDFPSRDLREIKQMLALRLPREIPSTLDEIVHHVHPVQGKSEEGLQTSVLVFCVSKELLNQEREVLKSFGIQPQQVFLSSVALASYTQQKIKTGSGLPQVVMMGCEGKGEVLLCNRFGIQFSRTFTYDTADLARSIQDAVLPIFEFIERKEKIEAYDFCVGGEIGGELFASHESTCLSLDPSKEKLPAIEFLLLAGAYVREEEQDQFNLLPEEVKQNFASVRSQAHLSELRVALVVLAAMVALLFICQAARTSLAVWFVNQKLADLEPSVREIKGTVRSVQVLQKIKLEKVRPLDLLVCVHEQAPSGINLSEFEYDEKEEFVRLKGRAESQSLINQYVRALEKVEWFLKVELQYSESIREGVRSQFQFAIQGILKGSSES